MKSGYDQFFKKARKAKEPRVSREKPTAPSSSPPESSPGRDQLIEELRQRVLANRKIVKKKRKFPTRLVLSAMILSFLCGVGMVFQDRITAGLEQIEVAAFGDAVAAPKEPAKKAPAAETPSQAKPRDWNDDEVNHFRKLVERKNALDAREAELARMESELNAQRDEVEKRLKALEETRRSISSVLQEKVAEDEKKIETLVQMYSSMKPVQAAKIIEAMDEDLAVQIIGRMKKKSAAEVMNLMNPEKAKTFSEKYAGYKKD